VIRTEPVSVCEEPAVHAERRLMGGRVAIDVVPGTDRRPDVARHDANAALDRLERWAARLSRFEVASEVSRLNDDTAPRVRVGPTLAAVLLWARTAETMTDGLVDVSMLDARLAAEGLEPWPPGDRSGGWRVVADRRGAIVERRRGRRIDLDGVAKGWLADRAASLLSRHSVVVVDADGDIAVRLAPGTACLVRVDDPREPASALAELTIAADVAPAAFGVATSGTSVHRWTVGGADRHHIIDPATGRPAVTDVVQATVVAGTARAAEAFAKAAVIAGSRAASSLLEGAAVHGAILLTHTGEVLATPAAMALL
jgi:thiamine biosynthesis lipoprotein